MIPASTDELEIYTPPSLENVEPKPVFRFRPASWADRRRFNQALIAEGLRFFTDDAIRAEVRRALKALWSEDQHAAQIGRLESFWAMVDYAAKDPDAIVDPAEADAAAELLLTVVDNWPLLRRMHADNHRFNEEAPMVALSLFLAGWSNVDVGFRLSAGQVDPETIAKLGDALAEIEERAATDKVEGVSPGSAFLQLAARAVGHLNTSKDQEKNSPAPSSTSSIPNGSRATSNGASETTSSRRARTPGRSSRKTRATS